MPPKKKALTSAERSKKYRQQKALSDPEFREKENSRVKRHRAELSPAFKQEAKSKNTEARKKKRQVDMEALQIAEREKRGPLYKTNAALGKARAKLAKQLPEDPFRAQEVLSSLQKIVESKIGSKEEVQQSPKVHGVSVEVKNLVNKFYYRQDVSVEFPGKKDYVRVRNADGIVEKLQKHILYLTLREAYKQFSMDEPEVKIGFTSFTLLRPANVLCRHKMPHNVCVCAKHANINFLISAIHQSHTDFPSGHVELLTELTCNPDNLLVENCQTGGCDACNQLNMLDKLVEMIGSSKVMLGVWYVNYTQWEKTPDAEGTDRLRKVEKNASLLTITSELLGMLPQFKIHRLVKHKQDSLFNEFYEIKDINNLLLQFDFSENAEITEQDEVQSAHWWHLNVAVFTACGWIDGKCSSFAVVTDYLKHDKLMTILSLVKILEIILAERRNKQLEKKEPVQKLNLKLFSDGAAQHFKQKFFWNAVTQIPSFVGIDRDLVEISYDYFATSHGKGAVDGVGGTVKRQVMSEVLARKQVISDVNDYAEVATKTCPSINIIKINSEEVELLGPYVEDRAFTDVRSLNGIRSAHHMEVIGPSKVKWSTFKGSSTSKVHNFITRLVTPSEE